MDDRESVRLICGDAIEGMKTLGDESVDAIISDPPYPMISRKYGMMTEADWHVLMRGIVEQSRRVLRPTGSAVFILQPNSRKLGSMRLWLWEFIVWVGRDWNLIQDAYWWNTAAMPEAHAIQGKLMRPSIKACVWLGPADCWRDQDAVLWDEAEMTKVAANCSRSRNAGREIGPSGQGSNRSTFDGAARIRGGVTPFNVIPTTHGQGASSKVAGSYGHGAGTPIKLADWWTRYISPPGGTILDPFAGSGTMGLAALSRGRSFIGIERDAGYFEIARRRLAEAQSATPMFDGSDPSIQSSIMPSAIIAQPTLF